MKQKAKNIQTINETESWFSEKINRTDKSLGNHNGIKKEMTQVNKIRYEKGDITTNTNEIQRIMRE
jgi:hypothetical protein